jgi:hypothetical protein
MVNMQVLKLAHGVASQPRYRCVRGQKVFPVTAITVAAVDRLKHRSTILGMNVDSHRRHLLKVIDVGYDRLCCAQARSKSTEKQMLFNFGGLSSGA